MLEAAERGSTLSRRDFEAALPELRTQLLNAQFDLERAPFSVIVVVDGDDAPGCQAILDGMGEWLDSRRVDVAAYGPPDEHERRYPFLWRYWQDLPARGRISAVLGSWTTSVVRDRVLGEVDAPEGERRLRHVEAFERTLAADGVLLLKFWFHVPREVVAKRAAKARKDPEDAWRHGEYVELLHERYDDVVPLVEDVLQRTSTGEAPWHVVESTDGHHAADVFLRTVLGALTERLAATPDPAGGGGDDVPVAAGDDPADAPPRVRAARATSALDDVDLSATLDEDTYHDRLARWQRKVGRRFREARDAGVPMVLVFEGWDAAGKGGSIRRLTRVLRAQDATVVAVAAPTEEERDRHDLWRFWRRVPARGRMVIFDRSWYGRVLVERVEGFATPAEWRRAYGEIREFEAQLVEEGAVVQKFWLHVDPDEQLRRFRARERTAYKKYKITDEDYRNRERWDDYVAAVDEMVARTHTERAPWHLVAANDKRHARVEVLKTVARALDAARR